MASRLELHEELITLLKSKNVYFQPPESKKMEYPCIVYHKTGVVKRMANNGVYTMVNKYNVITIEYDPDGDLSDRLLMSYANSAFDRGYVSGSLNHKSHTIYY